MLSAVEVPRPVFEFRYGAAQTARGQRRALLRSALWAATVARPGTASKVRLGSLSRRCAGC